MCCGNRSRPRPQATAEQHEVKNAGLVEALDLLPELPEKGEYKLHFPVPEHRFARFGKRKIATGEGSDLLRKSERVKKVLQYALKVVLRRPAAAAVVASVPHVPLLRL